MRTHSLLLILSLSIANFITAVARSEPPRVRFDVGQMIECHDVTPDDFAESNPDERIVKAAIEVSTLIEDGGDNDLLELLYRFETSGGPISIVDYEPKTTLGTQHAGNISIEKKTGSEQSIGATVPIPNKVSPKAGGSAGITKTKGTSTKTELLPPKQLLSASGTIRRGQGVYFKLKPSIRTTLEGAKRFVIVLRVPLEWRADLMHVQCRATGNQRGVVRQFDEQMACGAADFVVPLYARGDAKAKEVAEEYVRAEQRLRQIAYQQRAEIQRRSYGRGANQYIALFSSTKPKIPKNWLVQLLLSPTADHLEDLDKYLPNAVRECVVDFRATRARLLKLKS